VGTWLHRSAPLSETLVSGGGCSDKEKLPPGFAVGLYPGHLAAAETNFSFNSDIHVTSQTPPTFLSAGHR